MIYSNRHAECYDLFYREKPYHEEIFTGSEKHEDWIYELSAKLACADGQVYIKEWHVATVRANFTWSGGDWDVTTAGTTTTRWPS